MIKAQFRVDFDKAAVFQFQNFLHLFVVTTKKEVLVSKCHSTRARHYVTIQVERGRQKTRSVNQQGRGLA